MCQSVQIKGGPYIETIEDLANLIGRSNILEFNYDEVVTPLADDVVDLNTCLCSIALRESLEKVGYSVRDGWDEEGCDWVAEKPQWRG